MPSLRVTPQPCISLAAMKGGSGKTTTALNLAGILALQQKRVLLIDLDPQTNLSTALNVSIKQDKLGVRYLLTASDYHIFDCAYPRGEFLDLVPADPDLGNLENELLMAPDGRLRLRRTLEKDAKGYDFIIIDCPPSIGALTQSALIAATDVIIPVDVGFFSVDGLSRMTSVINQVRDTYNPELSLAGVLATKYDSRTTLSEQTIEAIKEQSLPVFKTHIRISVDIIRAQMARLPISGYAPDSNADREYQALAEELLPAKVIPLRRRARQEG